MAGLSVPIAIYGAGRLGAQVGAGLAAGEIIDAGINRAVPYALAKSREATSKYKLTHGLSKGIGLVEKGYNSKAGKVARTVATVAGGVLAFGAAGQAIKSAPAIRTAIIRGAGQVGKGLNAAFESRLGQLAYRARPGQLMGRYAKNVQRFANNHLFNPKKEAPIRLAAAKFNQAKANLSNNISQIGKAGKEGATRVKEGAQSLGRSVEKQFAKTPKQIADAERQQAKALAKSEMKKNPKVINDRVAEANARAAAREAKVKAKALADRKAKEELFKSKKGYFLNL